MAKSKIKYIEFKNNGNTYELYMDWGYVDGVVLTLFKKPFDESTDEPIMDLTVDLETSEIINESKDIEF